jgi:hypothetical protein
MRDDMRLHVKKELLKMIQMLMEANETIQNNIGVSEINLMVDLLVSCQQSAIQVGERIEYFEEEGTITVSLLEEYCELVYQLSLALEDAKRAKKITKLLRSLLQKISNSITYDIPVSKKEVIFLPYKASMWDSLESVWKAAYEDSSCDTYVIPIPYFDKNSDGSLGKMYYEGYDYPDYVPITPWEEYDFLKRSPDIAYIHNPYDNTNKVTSIHPNFYARELKKHVGLLVYIPYFVTPGDVPKHFCVLPGTMHADKVIVSTEKEKKTYIEEFKKFELDNNRVGIFGNLEEKFLVLGSPKIDKVKNTTRDNIEIPKEWQKLIKKPDGSSKTIILYNTTIQLLLNHKEDYLEKLQDVFEFFHEKRDEYTLLWRPHPLMEKTIFSMTPNLVERYKRMVIEFKNKAFGIYDDTADIHRAIALSDAYYGDGGSVVELYKETGKPYMIQNVKVKLR